MVFFFAIALSRSALGNGRRRRVRLAAQPATLLPACERIALARRVAPEALHQVVEIDGVAVEVEQEVADEEP